MKKTTTLLLILLALFSSKTMAYVDYNEENISQHPSVFYAQTHEPIAPVMFAVPEEEILFEDRVSQRWELPHFVISSSIGPAWRTANLDVRNEFRFGGQFNFSFGYFPSNFFGVRLNYQRFFATHEHVTIAPPFRFNMSNRTAINAVYPSFVFRVPVGDRVILETSFGLGYISFLEESKRLDVNPILQQPNIARGSAMCTQLSAGLELRFTRSFSGVFNMSNTTGLVSRITDREGVTTTLFDDNRVGLGQFSLQIGLRYNFF